MALFESYERRIDKINAVLNSYGIASIEEAEKITKDAGLDVYEQVKKIQPICFENACWAYTVGAAIAIKKGCRRAADAAAAIGEGLQAFCIPGSVADCDCSTYCICPASVLETDWLNAFDLIVYIKTCVFCDFLSFFDRSNAIAV